MSGSLLGPVTDADQRRWQRSRLNVLVDLVEFGEEHKLTPLTWTLGVHALFGTSGGHHDTERRTVFEDWASALGLERWDHQYETGRIHLHAESKDLWGRGVLVQVMADLWVDEPPA